MTTFSRGLYHDVEIAIGRRTIRVDVSQQFGSTVKFATAVRHTIFGGRDDSHGKTPLGWAFWNTVGRVYGTLGVAFRRVRAQTTLATRMEFGFFEGTGGLASAHPAAPATFADGAVGFSCGR